MKRYLAAMALLLGTIVVAVAILATQIGLDHNAGWGLRRTALLFFGILIVALAIYFQFRYIPSEIQIC